MELFYDKRISVYNKGRKITVKAFTQIKKYLDRMDQNEYSEVVFVNISIGGGNGEYIVVFNNDSEYYNLINKNCIKQTEEKKLVVGGQKGIFQKRQIVDYNMMIKACDYYYKNNSMDEELIWEK